MTQQRLSRRQALLALGAALALPTRSKRLAPGTWARVTWGPSAGKIVRLERHAPWVPGCNAAAIFTLRPTGTPVWVVSEFLEWDVRGKRYRLTLAPWTALEPV